MSDVPTCPICGGDMHDKREGYCLPCWQERQDQLDLHNATFDRWAKMSDRERDEEIARSAR